MDHRRLSIEEAVAAASAPRYSSCASASGSGLVLRWDDDLELAPGKAGDDLVLLFVGARTGP